MGKLVANLRAGKVDRQLELFSGGQHGFTNPLNASEERADREYKGSSKRFLGADQSGAGDDRAYFGSGARFSVSSIYVPHGSVRNATLVFEFGI